MTGRTLTVRGDRYVIVSVGPMGTGKFFGRRRFILRRASDGALFATYGKQVTAASKLAPVDSNPYGGAS